MKKIEGRGKKNMNTFTLAALEFLDNIPEKDQKRMQRMRKVLKEHIYIFNNRVKISENGNIIFNDKHISNDFFAENITVQAIVGKNGSGKSSVLEMVYRVMNNVGFIASYIQNLNPTGIDPSHIKNGYNISFVEGVYAKLYFTKENYLCWIECRGEHIIIKIDDNEYELNNTSSNGNDREKIHSILCQIFYSIVTNYSVQSLVNRDYASESTKSFVEWHDKKSGETRLRLMHKGTSVNWIDGIFHKNDGYLAPIVLNPYRKNGCIDMEREEDLTKERLVAMLLWEKDMQKLHILNDYKCENIEFSFDFESLSKKYIEAVQEVNEDSDISKSWEKNRYKLSSYFISLIKHQNADNFAKEILTNFNVIDKIEDSSSIKVWGAMYLVYKTFNIAATYPSYANFRSISHLSHFSEKAEEHKQLVCDLVKKILDDDSHITTKLKRVLNFLELSIKEENKLITSFDFNTYLEALGYNKDKKSTTFEKFNKLLPPPLFKTKILLKKGNDSFDFYSLSSGERQMIFTATTFLYHIMNIVSINDNNRIQYKNICMILDEVEICFHPELQKALLWNLIEMTKSFGLNKKCSLNIILATHSPFILSDIPQGNILYLKEGITSKDEISVNPFAANVNEILAQSFFLSEGFMGNFSVKKIESLVEYLKNEHQDSNWTKEKALELIDNIGEPLIKRSLISLFNKRFNTDKERLIKWYEEQLDKLKNTK